MTELNNDKRFEDGVKAIRELGRESAMGKDSLPKLAFKLTELAADGVIDLEKKWSEPTADGGTRLFDDAEYFFNEFVKAEGKKAIHERSNGGLKANISKARQFIAFGAMTTCDPQDVLDRTVKVRAAAIADSVKVKSAYAAYVDIARFQQGIDADATDEQIASVIRKPEPSAPEVEKILKRVCKTLEDLIAGEKGVQDQSELVDTAFQAVRDRLAEIDAVNNADDTADTLKLLPADKLAAMLAAMGYQKAA